MTREVRFSKAAQEEFEESAAYYHRKVYGLGDAFADEIYRLSKTVAEAPEMYQSVGDNVRRAVARKFPFSIYFRVYENEIFVFSVFHGRRNPAIWESRS